MSTVTPPTGDPAGRSREGRPCDNRFETILNSISDGVFAVDRQWRITCFNAAAERTLGVTREEAIGERCSAVFRSNICEEACALRYTLETGIPIVNLPIHIRDTSGRVVPVTVSTALIRDEAGEVVGGVETFRDLNLVKTLLKDVGRLTSGEPILTADVRVKKLLEIVPTIAESDSTVLIEGESGTGKGLLAGVIHHASSRRDGPMVTISCGALPETLLESELFGYRKGAFTGADRDKPGRVQAAERGTLFLDEIGELPPLVQVKLLRLMDYPFPGNVRELENILEHGYVLCTGRRIEEADLPEWLTAGPAAAGDRHTSLEDLEAGFIRGVLARNQWNRTLAASELGIHKTTLHRKIRRLGIALPAEDGRSARKAGGPSAARPTSPSE